MLTIGFSHLQRNGIPCLLMNLYDTAKTTDARLYFHAYSLRA